MLEAPCTQNHLVEAQCALQKPCYPETPLGSHPTSRVSQSSHIGDRILYTTTAGGRICHRHFDPLPGTSGIQNVWVHGRIFLILYTTGPEAEHSVVNFSKNQYHHCIKSVSDHRYYSIENYYFLLQSPNPSGTKTLRFIER